jgi:hypothetical protein
MAANLTIYCLQEITDYFEFERLCNGLMSLEGYNSIEPLGGFSDKGRDAIHVNKSNETTIFAYSVREDWRAKLAEDAKKISEHGHICNQLTFITTAKFTPSQRDEAITSIQNEFGWRLDLFGVERLQILLDINYPQIKELYPGIFPPEFLAIQDQIYTSEKQNHLFISSVPEDRVFAEWLTRKLTAEGYLVWYEWSKLLGGETYPDDVDDTIKNRTFRFLGLYSRASLRNPEVMRQRSLALNIANERNQDFLIPLNVDGISDSQLDQVTKALKFIPFDNWAKGLKQLLEKLKTINCPQLLPQGKRIAAEIFLEKDILSEETETLFSNCLRIHQIPEVIHRFKVQNAISKERLEELKCEWSYREVNQDTFLSFHEPPASIMREYRMIKKGGALWTAVERIDGIWSPNLVSELIKKALIVRCYQKGLQYCPKTKLLYFPPDLMENNRLKFTRHDGLKTYVNARGKRTYPPGREYLYSLAPSFYVRQDLFDDFTVLIRIRVRLSDTEGKPFTEKRTINSRRKHLCKNWWNNDWLSRILAVSQFLADGEKIAIGEQRDEQIIVETIPLHLNAPIGINESALNELSYERSELLRIYDEYSDEDINNDTINDD